MIDSEQHLRGGPTRRAGGRPAWAAPARLLTLLTAASARLQLALVAGYGRGAGGAPFGGASSAQAGGGPAAGGGLEVSDLFGDDMVLSRANARVFGRAPPGTAVEVRVQRPGGHVTARARAAEDGRWLAELGALAPGGPWALNIAAEGLGRRTLSVRVGDVWIMAGQSNAEYALERLIREAPLTVAPADVAGWRARAESERLRAGPPDLRLLRLSKAFDRHERVQPELSHPWAPAVGEVRANDSLTAILLGEHLCRNHRVPVGVIQLTAGGTYLREWLAPDRLAALAPLPAGGHPSEALARSSQIWRAMVAPLAGLSVTGLVWAHGESDVESGDHAAFELLQREAFSTFRRLFAAPRLPIVNVQVADWLRDWRLPALPNFSRPLGAQWVREAQSLSPGTDPFCAVVVTFDLSDPSQSPTPTSGRWPDASASPPTASPTADVGRAWPCSRPAIGWLGEASRSPCITPMAASAPARSVEASPTRAGSRGSGRRGAGPGAGGHARGPLAPVPPRARGAPGRALRMVALLRDQFALGRWPTGGALAHRPRA